MMRLGRVLVVDDEAVARRDLAQLLSREGYEVEHAADAFKALGKYETFEPHVVITDLKLPGMDGIALAQRIRELDTPASIIVITGFGEIATAIEAMRAGVVEYLAKPINFSQLLAVLDRVVKQQKMRVEAQQLRLRPYEKYAPNIIGSSPAMTRMFEVLDKVARSPATVLISGESGTGKELVATALHTRSPDAGATRS